MFKNYIKIAWRNLKKNKLTSYINIFGLTVSISICLLISLFVFEETNYDKFEADHERIYRAEQLVKQGDGIKEWAASPAAFKNLFLDKYQEVEFSTRLLPSPYAFIKVGEKLFKEEDCFQVDSTFFDVMGLNLLHGDPEKALAEPTSVVISEKMSKKFFNSIDVLGRTLEINSSPYKVTGILKDLPENSHLQVSVLRSIMLSKNEAFYASWVSNTLYTYLKLKPGVNPNRMQDKFATDLVKQQFTRNKEDLTFRLHNISDIHLGGNIEKELSPNSSWVFVYIFISIGVLVLLLASINYINLTTSRSLERAREIGVRKALGAHRRNIIIQFITESVVVTLLSYILALVVVWATLPLFNQVAEKQLSLSFIMDQFFLLVSISIVLFIGFIGGIYPAFVISAFDPVNTLKGIVASNAQTGFSFFLRKGLVIFQFVISAFLVISSLVVIKQINFMFDKPLGFNKENMIVLPAMNLSDETLRQVKNDLKSNPSIVHISATSATPGKRVILGGMQFPEREGLATVRMMFVDRDYFKTMQVNILKGRDFDNTIGSDTTANVIINQAAAKNLNFKDPIGENAFLVFGTNLKNATIIGVSGDFHQASLHKDIEATVFVSQPMYYSMIVRYKGEQEKVKSALAATWKKVFPNELFTYTVMDDDIKTLYRSETTFKRILMIFTVLAIVIASLGLFGLIFFSNELRKKEIGVRKVLGAANSSIVYLLSKEYVVLIVVALLISLPLAHFAIQQWLQNFAYRTQVSWLTYITGTAITLLIALSTILVQGSRSASVNPVKNLRTE
jgi:putative ABC transport system permease protein